MLATIEKFVNSPSRMFQNGGSHSWNTKFPHDDFEIIITMKNFILYILCYLSKKRFFKKKLPIESYIIKETLWFY
jgi:hypothetical protein